MSDCEQDTTQEDSVSDTSCEDELPQSEEEEEEEEYNVYDDAIERYAQLIEHVPEDKVNGIVETVEKIFEHRFEEQDHSDLICGVLLSGAVILVAAVAKMYLF